MLPKAVAEMASNGHAQATARSLVKFYRVRPVSMQNRPASRARAATGAALSSHRDPRPALARRADIRVHEGVVSADRSFAHQLHRLLCQCQDDSLVREPIDATQSRPPGEQHRICSGASDLRTARSVCLQDRRPSEPAPFPGSLYEHDNRDRPALTSGVLHRHRTRSVCAA